ncbi:MAG: metal-dependent transcriptional regulator [Planctomycetota bacterium]|jgi:DtxR family Mn-dependent transcriptional regulator
MATSTVEDYLKHIYLEGGSSSGDLVPMGRLARAMSVAPGTATAMVKSLVRERYVRYEPYAGVRLSRRGQKVALRILRRHRVIELFLVEALDMDWSEVHVEAEQLEHAVSERVLERMDAFLGRPGFDPHGDPIPAEDGSVSVRELNRLHEAPVGGRFRVARIADQAPGFLRGIEQLGLVPGTALRVESRDDGAGTMRLKLGRAGTITVAGEVAARVLVEASAGR